MMVQFAGPQNLRSCPEPEGRRRGQSLSWNCPGFKDAGNAKQALHPTGRVRLGLLRSHPQAPASEGCESQTSARNLEAGARGKPRPGGARGSGRAQRAALVHKGPGPSFPSLLPSGHFIGPGQMPGRARGPLPRPPPVLSLGTLASLPRPSSIAPAPILSRANPEPVWCRLYLAFSVLVLSHQQSRGGKAQTKKLPLKNFSETGLCTGVSETQMHLLLPLPPSALGLELRSLMSLLPGGPVLRDWGI